MYGLSVKQKYASLIAIGKKTIEWRSKPWKYRGPVVICASKNPRIKLDSGHYLPTGAAVCIVDIIGCRPIDKSDLAAACCLDYLEYIYGPPQGFAWILDNPREIVPIPVRGMVAPWIWKGSEPVLAPGWHSTHIGFARR